MEQLHNPLSNCTIPQHTTPPVQSHCCILQTEQKKIKFTATSKHQSPHPQTIQIITAHQPSSQKRAYFSG